MSSTGKCTLSRGVTHEGLQKPNYLLNQEPLLVNTFLGRVAQFAQIILSIT